jgi:outer membrane protein TolC
MLIVITRVLALYHTGWYDRLMFRKASYWRNCVIGATGLLVLGWQSVKASDDLPLRPPYPQPEKYGSSQSGDPGSLGRASDVGNSSSAHLNDAGSARASATVQGLSEDYDEHLKNLKRAPRSQPTPASTGASPDDYKGASSSGSDSNSIKSSGNDSSASDEMAISAPRLESLISVNEYLSPFSLDASTSNAITLKDALNIGLDRNLDLAISRTQTKQDQFAYYSSLGKFLPDPTFGYSEYFANGHVGLPFNVFGGQSTQGGGVGSGRDATVKVNRPFIVMHAGAEFFAYRGGSVLFGALQSRNNYRARSQGEKATLSDTLLTISQNYYNLVLADTLLQIRIDAVRTSQEQLKRNQSRFHSGLATNLEVLQSKTQLSRDRQALVDQQINRRSAAITLANTLNMNLGQDLKPATNIVQKIRLIDPHLSVGQVLQLAIDHRPELKQYEQLRLAAKKAIVVSAANLQPTVSLSGQAYGIGPPSNVQSLGVFTVNANWRLKGFGTVDSMDVIRAKWEARQAALQSQKELQTVCSQVRNSYLQILDKERNVAEASNEVLSSAEELRLAELRKASGLGINLDIITAQRDLTQARVSKAQAIIDYNIAQVQLLHDTGMISIAGLTSGRLLNRVDLN